MPSPAPIAPAAIRSSLSIRVGIVLLAAVAFALSYDALRQMAVASHVRGLLTYLFPLVIDGFIAIGIVALLLLRTAPVRSRLYVWALVGVATGTSISANVVHAVGLNEGTRLHLNNATAGALSAIAPLALAGAVHLYLVINRHLAADSTVSAMAEAPSFPPAAAAAMPKSSRSVRQEPANATTAPSAKASNGPEPKASAATAVPPTAKPAPKTGGRKTTVPDDVLRATARALRAETGKVSRTDLEKAVRAKHYTIRKDLAQETADAVMAEPTSATTADPAT
ncbi:hypothetical protein GCM10023080_063090 [Streptomyces pseudoechinosporeus]|nr:DUF2637 domain-containing protein [Streptomyces fulvoviolaceus]MCT9079332.1 DUF2637 domain-containing protein [Streptomyces fulvoviolaceus]